MTTNTKDNAVESSGLRLPEEFIHQLNDLFPDDADAILQAYKRQPVVSIRLNPSKIDSTLIPDRQSVAWEPNGLYLQQRPLFTADPLFHSGAYYVQEASSMFLGYVVREIQKQHSITRVLDLSAAPGGKTTHLCSVLPDSTLIVANEIIPARARILKETIQKWGASNCVVTQNKPEDMAQLPHFFDLMVIDAPCSGEGMFRKDPESIAYWSSQAVTLCAERQKNILDQSWIALKPGGFLLYSTCTLNREENESIAEYIHHTFKAKPIHFPALQQFGVLTTQHQPYVYRCIPGLVEGEGFSFCCFQKSEEESRRFSRIQTTSGKKLRSIKKELSNQLTAYSSKPVEWFQFMESYLALPGDLAPSLLHIFEKLYVIKVGVTLGELKGNEIRPETEWVLSNLFNPESLPEVLVDYEKSLTYLKRETLFLDELPAGFCVVRYKDIALGTAKCSANRVNNVYPANWRIRMNIPSTSYFSLLP